MLLVKRKQLRVTNIRCSKFEIFTASWPRVFLATLWWILAHEAKYSLEYIYWIVNYLVIKLGQLIDIHGLYSQDCILRENFLWFGGLFSIPKPFLIFFFFFLKVCTETIKNKHYLLKINISKITSRFYQNQKRTLNCFPDFAVGLKRVWSVCHRSYWYQTKFHLILKKQSADS